MKFPSLFKAGKVIAATTRSIQEQRRQATELVELPMPELVRTWLAAINGNPESWQGRLRTKPTADQLAAAASRLGAELPAQLVQFYSACNGVTPMSAEFPNVLLPVQALVPGHQHRPPLSAQCETVRRKHSNGSEEPACVRVMRPELVDLAGDPPVTQIPFEDVDTFVALEIPRGGRCVAMVIDATTGFAPGTILDFDDLLATCYDSLTQWLAARAAQLGRGGRPAQA